MRCFGCVPSTSLLFVSLFLFVRPAYSQAALPEVHRDWDVSLWVAGETGEEILNNFSEAQILTAGVFAGK
ncbi:MAG: hypothetical protein WBW70_11015, partial [Candidatus Sulfotelmatobacter sp.]